MRCSTLEQWLQWQQTCHRVGIDLGLERVARVAQRLQLSQHAARAKVIIVAGTNGKGSCVRSLERLLLLAGKRCGAFTSPHLLTYNERIQIDAKAVSDADLLRAFAEIDRVRAEVTLTYFEFSALAAMWLFSCQRLDYWVLEVGLGGRLDATNIIDCDYAIVTSIDLDHTEWLGDTRAAIAREKAAVCRPGKRLLCADPKPPDSLAHTANEIGAEYMLLQQVFDFSQAQFGSHKQTSSWLLDKLSLSDINLPVPSVAAALWCLHELGVLVGLSSQALRATLEQLQLPGRFQSLYHQGRHLILDVAHNPAAMELAVQRLLKRGSEVDLVLAMMADKDTRHCLSKLCKVTQAWYLCSINTEVRASSAAALAEKLAELDGSLEAQCFESVALGLRAALQNGSERPILITGSFYTVAAVLSWLSEAGDYETVG